MKQLLDTWDERHAFIIGFCEIIPPWPAYYKGDLLPPQYLGKEVHYYYAGRTFGAIALSGLVFGLFWLFRG